ncbi:MAG: cation-translocating P-type ATPase [Puia sp.]
METINWKVEGMSCSACAQTVEGFLKKKGMREVNVSLTAGEVSFQSADGFPENELKKGLSNLGYFVPDGSSKKKPVNRFVIYLAICIPFTVVLMLHMFSHRLPFHWLGNAWVQFALCVPVYLTGMYFFGRSAIGSLVQRKPNMNVLIALGATAAFAYSVAGTLLHLGETYLFYETSAAIITLVFLGNYVEERSLHSTQKALQQLLKSQELKANMLTFDDQHQEMVFPVDSRQLRSGDLILIKTGEQVPADAKILWGEAQVDEAIITGESFPLSKQPKDLLIGGSLLLEGTVKAQVMHAAKDSVLSNVINLVKRAQQDKPEIQLLADRISAVFVPVVIGIAIVCLLVNYLLLHDLTASLMRSIAVLVIACPCAMGLATPAAIAVGLGRAARNGILFRNANSLELFKDIRQVVFDKTGTLTTGSFSIRHFHIPDKTISESDFKRILFSLEKYSNHPIAKSIARSWKTQREIRWAKLEEIKGLGIRALDAQGNEYKAGSWKFFTEHKGNPIAGQSENSVNPDGEGGLQPDVETGTGWQAVSGSEHSVYITKNSQLIGWLDIQDEIRPEAVDVVHYFKAKNIRTILLSGDRLQKCREVAQALGMDEVIAEQSPVQKLEQITRLSAIVPTAMVGDGINDAPALAKASLGISMSDASQIALQTADVVLMNSGLKKLPMSLQLGKLTFSTIRQNLFWAFFYNIIAIPVAAIGLLTPAIGALAMALSDVVLLINSSRLFVKKLR